MRKISVLVLFFALVFSVAAFKTSTADEASDKIDKVLRGQEQILAKLDEIKSELAVVKVRATQQ